jgi:EAL domain-containing protein (putative c-di-GMP-specific phosphodiesterase class I)
VLFVDLDGLLQETVNLAHAIGVLAIAEGVESDAQLASIDMLGCDLAQGYLFAHPASPDQVTQQLSDQRQGSKTPAVT